jgi:hypothetical protein
VLFGTALSFGKGVAYWLMQRSTRPVSRCLATMRGRLGAGAQSLTAHHGCTEALMIAQRFTSRLRRLIRFGPHCEDPAERVNSAPAVGPLPRSAVWRPAGYIFLFCSVAFRLAVGCMIILLCIFFGPLVYFVRTLLRPVQVSPGTNATKLRASRVRRPWPPAAPDIR